MQISNILKGWKSYFKGDHPSFAMARAEICKACPSAVVGTFEQWIPESAELKKIQGLKCDICKCPLSAKLRSPEEICPESKW